MLIYRIQRRKLFNFNSGGNDPEHKGGKCYFINLCVCVCVFNLKQCVKKNQPKKTMHKIMNFGSTNRLNRNRSLGTQQNVTIFLQYLLFLAMVDSGLIFYYFILE